MDLLRIFLVEFLTGSLRTFNPDVFFIMKLCTNQSIPCEFLKGACIFLSDEDEGRYIKEVCVDLEKHSIILIDDDGNGMYWESLRNASIQFQGGR